MHKNLFVMLMENKNSLNAEIVKRHVEHLRKLDDSGRLTICGPFSDYAGGMVVISAETKEEADEIFKSDPFISEGYKTYQLRTLESADRENNYLLD